MRRIDSQGLLLPAGVSLGLLCLYLVFLPSQLTWANYGGDGGDFLAAILSGGVPHPSGYPTYVLLGRLFQQLPWGAPYWRGALLSAVSMAAAAGLWSVWLRRFLLPQTLIGRLAAVLAGLAWGTAPLVWSQALIVEVHGLQALLAVAWLWWIGLLLEGVRGWRLHLLALVGGFSLGNHVTILLLAPALAAALWVARRRVTKRFLAGQAGSFAVGTLVYLTLPLAARAYPPVNWGNPQTWQGLWWTVSGQPYQHLLFETPPGALLDRVSAWARQWIDQFGLPGLVVCVVGATQPLKERRATAFLLAWTFLAYSVFAISYNVYDSLVYLLPAYLAASAWLAVGVVALANWRWRGLRLGVWAAVGLSVFLAARLPFTARAVDPRPHNEAARYVENYLQEAPRNAILLTQSDADTFPLWYAHFGLGQRPDVRVIVLPLTQYPWYRETLVHTYPDLSWPPMDALDENGSDWRGSDWRGSDWGEAAAALNPERAVCRSESDPSLSPEVRYVCR